jgi:O-antigen/teichoic acid export membrane protein
VITIAVSPIITRIYTPAEYGVYSLFFAVYSILAIGATGQYEFAIVLPSKEEDSANIGAVSILSNLAISAVLFIVVMIFGTEISTLLGNKIPSNLLFTIPIAVFLTGIYQSFLYWNNRSKNYQLLAYSRVVLAAGTAVVAVFLGYLKFGSEGLITTTIIAQFLAVLVLAIGSMVSIKTLVRNITFKSMKAQAREHRQFPFFSLPSALLDSFSSQIPVLFISRLFDAELLGLYSLAMRILALPMSLVGEAVGKVFYKSFVDDINKGVNPKTTLFNTWKLLFVIGIVPFTLLLFFGPALFSFVFGVDWAEAGRIASLIVPMSFAIFISSPTSTAFYALKMQKYSLVFAVFALIYRVAAIYLGYRAGDFFVGLRLLVLMEVIQVVIYNALIVHRLNRWKK